MIDVMDFLQFLREMDEIDNIDGNASLRKFLTLFVKSAYQDFDRTNSDDSFWEAVERADSWLNSAPIFRGHTFALDAIWNKLQRELFLDNSIAVLDKHGGVYATYMQTSCDPTLQKFTQPDPSRRPKLTDSGVLQTDGIGDK